VSVPESRQRAAIVNGGPTRAVRVDQARGRSAGPVFRITPRAQTGGSAAERARHQHVASVALLTPDDAGSLERWIEHVAVRRRTDPDLCPGDRADPATHRARVWTFHSTDRSQRTARAQTEQVCSRLRNLEHREIDLLSRLSVLHERRELYPQEVTEPQVAELDRKLDAIREEIVSLRAELPACRDT
jgi:hypothetical protein